MRNRRPGHRNHPLSLVRWALAMAGVTTVGAAMLLAAAAQVAAPEGDVELGMQPRRAIHNSDLLRGLPGVHLGPWTALACGAGSRSSLGGSGSYGGRPSLRRRRSPSMRLYVDGAPWVGCLDDVPIGRYR